MKKRRIFRARYTGGRGAWVTTVWRRTRKEAQDDIKLFARPRAYGYTGTKIVSMGYDVFLKKYQRTPKF